MDEIPGNRESKRRAKLILQTITGELSVEAACEQMGVGATHFADLRTQFLRFGTEGLNPKPVGRPRRPQVEEHDAALAQRVAALERENRLLRAQVELAALRREASSRSKSRGKAAPRSSSPRSDTAG